MTLLLCMVTGFAILIAISLLIQSRHAGKTNLEEEERGDEE